MSERTGPRRGRSCEGGCDRLPVVRPTYVIAGGSTGAILALVASAMWQPQIGSLVTSAIAAIAAIVGAALGVLALAVSGSCCET